MTEASEAWVQWVLDTCLLWGTQLSTAHAIAAHFADGFERGELVAPEPPIVTRDSQPVGL
jgi:hypothetical protein